MTREELEHAIRAACDLTNESEMIVFGSQAILGQFPDAPDELRQSTEADMMPKYAVEKALLIDAILGEDSDFHRTHGFYVHGVSIEAAILPDGWEARAVRVQNENTRNNIGWCIEAHDLAASKLAAYRDKDREFVRDLLQRELIHAAKLRLRLGQLAESLSDPTRKSRLMTWLEVTVKGLNDPPDT